MKKIFLAFIGVSGLYLGTDITFNEVSEMNLPLQELKGNSMDVESSDLDGDGDLDVVVAVEFGQNKILINDGRGKFSCDPASLPPKKHDSEDIALADFDKDGDIDIIFVSEDDYVHEYYINDGKGHFTDVSERIPVTSTCNAIVAADFDMDGDLDLVLGNDGQEFLLMNDGKGYFHDETLKKLPGDITTTQDVEAADLDGDKDLDLLIGNENGNKFYLNDGKGNFKDVTKDRLPFANEETRKVDIADIDGDGDNDIFFSNVDFTRSKSKANRLLINNGKGFFTDETATRFLAENDQHTGDASFVDLNSDGYLDLVIANVFFGYMQVCINNGKGVFVEATDKYFRTRVIGEGISLLVADFNNDHFPDLYFGMFRSPDRLFFGRRKGE